MTTLLSTSLSTNSTCSFEIGVSTYTNPVVPPSRARSPRPRALPPPPSARARAAAPPPPTPLALPTARAAPRLLLRALSADVYYCTFAVPAPASRAAFPRRSARSCRELSSRALLGLPSPLPRRGSLLRALSAPSSASDPPRDRFRASLPALSTLSGASDGAEARRRAPPQSPPAADALPHPSRSPWRSGRRRLSSSAPLSRIRDRALPPPASPPRRHRRPLFSQGG